jgi:hypothetical protein
MKITGAFQRPERTAKNNVIFDGQWLAAKNNKKFSAAKNFRRFLAAEYNVTFNIFLLATENPTPSKIMKYLVISHPQHPSHSLSYPAPNLSHTRCLRHAASLTDAACAPPTLSPHPSSQSKPSPPYAVCPA